MALISSFMTPETYGRDLLNTIEEAKIFHDENRPKVTCFNSQ